MKKHLAVVVALLLITSLFLICESDNQNLQAKLLNENKDKPAQGSKEELYQDAFVTMLLPTIEKEVEKHYGEHFIVAPYQVDVISVNRPNGYRTFLFEIVLEFMPYWGPHNSIGLDRITLEVSSRNVKVLEFKHLESYDLPEHLR